MPNVEPLFVLYALLLEPGGCLRAHITLFELVEPRKFFFLVSMCLVGNHTTQHGCTSCCVNAPPPPLLPFAGGGVHSCLNCIVAYAYQDVRVWSALLTS